MLVSILIPCFNAERWVAQAIESALAQTWSEKEVIVLDDGSTDRSFEEIKKFQGRIRWETGPNRGGNAARNRLLELAQGEWLQYLDADDYLLPAKLENQVSFVRQHSHADIVFGPLILEYLSENETRQEDLPIPQPHDEWVLLARWRLPQTGSPLWRKQAIVDVGGWKKDLRCCQEHELYLRLLMARKRFVFCPDNGSVYRQWPNNSVSTRDIAEVHCQRLDIEQSLEHFLGLENELTYERLTAINQARFEIARVAWAYDQRFAFSIIRKIRASQPGFVPKGSSGRLHYRLAYRALGFGFAEKLAEWKRAIVAQ